MSHEARLARLGLNHLKDDPEALRRETERRIAEYDQSTPPEKPAPEWAQAMVDGLRKVTAAQ